MTDSLENVLQQGDVEETAQVTSQEIEETTQETVEATAQDTVEETSQETVLETKAQVVDRLREVSMTDAPDKTEVDKLKSVFYRLHFQEREAQMKEYLEAGGNPETYTLAPDALEEEFKALMGIVREKREAVRQQQEAEKEANLKVKLNIIEKIKAMATSPDEAGKCYQEFKELQQQWREIKAVPAERAADLWRQYQHYVEQFYDLLKLNNEAREYDFRKNLETKTRLCEAAEKLAEEEDVLSAFHQLQELHSQYRETGPVAKEQREEIWARFKAASTVINKRHQQHFEQIRATEDSNLERKTALCEKVEAIVAEEPQAAAEWEERTKAIIEIQNEWKTIGFAPQKMNVKIFERFRAVCDDFFSRKAAFFKQAKQIYAENLEKKRLLVEQAQALQDSTEWRSTGDKLVALQKEWKTIGFVPRKQGDKLWADFLAACNIFFEARKAATSDTRTEERENLQKKRDVISRLKALLEEKAENAAEAVKQLCDEYAAIGHVPFRDKDKLYKEYREVLDAIYKELNISQQRRRLDQFAQGLKNVARRGEDAVESERVRLLRRYDQLCQEVKTYENNLGFFSATSKKANSFVEEVNRKIQRLKDEIELTRQKIKAIDEHADDEVKE